MSYIYHEIRTFNMRYTTTGLMSLHVGTSYEEETNFKYSSRVTTSWFPNQTIEFLVSGLCTGNIRISSDELK